MAELNHDEQTRVNHYHALQAKRKAGGYVTDHELDQARQIAENQQHNAEWRAARRARLAAERTTEQAQRDAAALAPVKATEQRRWLAEHPGYTVADFERDAWPHLRANLAEQGQQDAVEREKVRLRATGKYGPI